MLAETEDNMLHSECGGLLGVCKENEFMAVQALDPRITNLLNPYFSVMCNCLIK